MSVGLYVTKICYLNVWEKHVFHKIGSCPQLLHHNFALKSGFKLKTSWNMKKWEWNGVSNTYLFCLSDVSLQRNDSVNFGPILEKTLFHTNGRCTLWPKMIMSWGKFGWWRGWREDQHLWDGQGLKDPWFFLNFFIITKL